MAKEMLRRGSDNETVFQLQQILFPQSPDEWDGKFGPRTESALEGFQQAHGLAPDGIVGPLTAAVINAIGPSLIDPEGYGGMEPPSPVWTGPDAGSMPGFPNEGVLPPAEPFFELPEADLLGGDPGDPTPGDPTPGVPTPGDPIPGDLPPGDPTPGDPGQKFDEIADTIFVDDLASPYGDANAEFAYEPQDYDALDPDSPAFVVNPDMMTASGMMSEYLDFFGLGPDSDTDLSSFVNKMINQGMPVTAVLSQLRMTEEYAVRFPAQKARRASGQAPLSETDYINLETGYRQLAQAAGIPDEFVDVNDITRLLTNDVSLNEWQARIVLAEEAAAIADPETIGAIKEMYGFTEGDITALYLESDKIKSVVDARRKLTGAGLATRADKILGTTTARNVKAELGSLLERANVQERELASVLTPMSGLSSSLLGESTMSGGTLTRGAFNLDPDSATALRRRRESRVAGFAGQSGALTTSGGVVGMGKAT